MDEPKPTLDYRGPEPRRPRRDWGEAVAVGTTIIMLVIMFAGLGLFALFLWLVGQPSAN